MNDDKDSKKDDHPPKEKNEYENFNVIDWDSLKPENMSDEEKFKLLLSAGGGGSKVSCFACASST